MKAAVRERYGDPRDVVHLGDVPVPRPGDDDVLVRVSAAGVNPADVFLTTGRPTMLRAVAGIRRPKAIVLGQDFAGVVEAVGRNVASFRPGDEVFGEADLGKGTGSYAEYVCAPHTVLAPKPASLTFEQAGALPMVGLTSLLLVRATKVGAGTRVLINGASGGIGHLAVQIAKAFGAEVTGVCSARNVAMVRSVGADHVVDYTSQDFTQGAERYDVVWDNVGNRPLRALLGLLGPRGVLLMNSGSGGRVLGPLPRMARGRVLGLVGGHPVPMLVSRPTTRDLVALRDLVDAGEVTPVIEAGYPLADAAAALERVATGHVAGKVVLSI
jgi:NADPH:quinone reductase-like Zn-dependent oxidoreductase